MKAIGNYIDHTALKPNVTKQQIMQLCAEAKEYSFASVCVNPTWVALAKQELAETTVAICTVIGFPLGATTSAVKAFETKEAIKNGATEVDMVINIGALLDNDLQLLEQDIKAVVEAANKKALVKVIIETALLTDDQKRTVCAIAMKAGCDFVKTSTGFSGGGATVADVSLMKAVVGQLCQVKASGGVKTQLDAEQMLQAGAMRIGTSSGIAIVKGEGDPGTAPSDY